MLHPDEKVISLSPQVLQEFDVELKNEKLGNVPRPLDHFLKVGCCPAATCSHFTVCVTVHIDMWS